MARPPPFQSPDKVPSPQLSPVIQKPRSTPQDGPLCASNTSAILPCEGSAWQHQACSMARSTPRYIKLQDFPAHNGNVNCIKIGTKSSGVLVTGGDDKKVNLWTIGAQTKALSLQGHSSPVESVTFDHNEEVVAAGAASGSIKLFDLDQAKVTRAMSGHRSNVLSLELSQYGLLSGSMDTNVKVWDLRGRDVMCTLKGHKAGVTHVRFSPDGKWVASAASDGQVKIWDLVANKLLVDLPGHTHAVTGLHFHPVEYLLGTCSADKTIKIWDLETFSLVEQTPVEATGIRAMAFHPNGRHAFAALQDGLRVWSWEPPPCLQHDSVEVPWYKVADVSVLSEKNKLVGCSFNQNFVGLWVVDLKDVRPFGPGGSDVRGSSEPCSRADLPVSRSDTSLPGAGADGGRGSQGYNRDRSSSASASTGAAPGRSGSGTGPSGGPLHRGGSEQLGARLTGAAVGPGPGVRSQSRGRGDVRVAGGASQDIPITVVAPAARGGSGALAGNGFGAARYTSAGAGTGDSLDSDVRIHVPPRPPLQPSMAAAAPSGRGGMVSVGVGVGDSLLRGQVDPAQLYAMAQGAGRLDGGTSPPAGARRAPANPIREEPEAASPGRRGGGSAGGSRPSDTDVLASITGKHEQVKSALAFRLSNLQMCRNFMQRGDMRGALSVVKRCGDASVGADLLQGILGRRDSMFTLDVVPDLVPVVEKVLSLNSEKQIQAGVNVASMLYRAFHQIIRDTCSQAARVGVDLSFEQRREKCMMARISLSGLSTNLAHVARQLSDSNLSYKAQDLAGELATL